MNLPPLFAFQKRALDSLQQRPSHVICVSPTGSGKTRIAQEFLKNNPHSRAVLISPLIALSRQHQLNFSPIKILSPESLKNPSIQKLLSEWQPNFWIIDECHCLWDWGESFRPAFGDIIPTIKKHWSPSCRTLWLTATLPPMARQDLLKKLEDAIPHPIFQMGEFDLPPRLELSVAYTPWENRLWKLLSWIQPQKRMQKGGIVFFQSRKSAERLFQFFKSHRSVSPFLYHAGLSEEERTHSEKQIKAHPHPLILATSAFGMGLDITQLNWACLWQAPPSILSLAQAIGRVGRISSVPSQALVLWAPEDFHLLEWIGAKSTRSNQSLIECFSFLRSHQCRRHWLRNYFSGSQFTDNPLSASHDRCDRCDICKIENQQKVTSRSVLSTVEMLHSL